MESPKASGNPALRVIVVVGLSLLMLLLAGVNFRRLVTPAGSFGYGTDLNAVVIGVTPGLPAANAGLRIDDRLDTSVMDHQELEELVQYPIAPSSGAVRTLSFYRGGSRHTIALTAVSEPMNAVNVASIVIQFVSVLAFVAIGSAVVLLRPEPATWGFFLFCVGYAPVDQTGLVVTVDTSLLLQASQLLLGLLNALGTVGLLVFAFRFVTPALPVWRRLAQFALVPILIAYAVLYFFLIYDTYVIFRPAAWIGNFVLSFAGVCASLAVVALVETYVRQPGAERQRIRWVVLGFAITLAAFLASQFIQTHLTTTPLLLYNSLSLVSALAPLAVAYAVVKHRVIDVNFIVSRTLVYGILTTMFVALFALIDWFVGHVLDQTRWALVAEIAVAIGVGFWLNGLHSRVDRFVDSVLFRKRHEAERRLVRLARGLPHATSTTLVDSLIVREPLDALELTSAAIFRRTRTGAYERATAMGWPSDSITLLAPDDPLVPYLEGERGALRLSEVHWSGAGVPTGAARPVIALPIVVRHRLEAIVLYGAHKAGEDFDPDELQWLNTLAMAAGAAIDHLEAEALREKLEEVMRERESWRLVLERHGWLPTGAP